MKTALVTGAGSGIGAAIARRFAEAGAHVAVLDTREDGVAAVVDAILAAGLSAEGFVCDVTDDATFLPLVEAFAKPRGGLDAVAGAAGIASRHTIPQMSAAEWRRVIDVNLTGAFLTIKAAAANASGPGASVTVISSIASRHIAYLSGVHYAASKAALDGLVRHAAFEFGRHGFRVNAVAPGPMSNRMGGGDIPPERQAATAANLPLQRVVEPEDIAEACHFLASPAARAITGVVLPVDAGFLTGRGVAYRPYFDLHDEAFG
jgi:NAD(P)-dependent dehydrogenase (short-subunit alcohol dehydrogenase family)